MKYKTFFNYNNPVNKILLHILFWIIVVTYFAWGFGFNKNYKASFINALFYLPGFMLMVYSLIYFLIPRYLIKKKFGYFFAGLLLVILLCTGYAWLAQLTMLANAVFKGMTMATGRAILPFIHVGGIAISIKLLKYWYLQKQQTLEAQQQKMVAELQLLKSQVHPHFLFNTLNNLYALSLEQSPKAPEIILKLSNLLRFMIYESNVPFIDLEKEILLLQEYIALEQLRYGDRLDVSVTINGDIKNKQIPPLLLLPLVENAFKHGTSNQVDQCWISFDMHVTDKAINFKLINSKDNEQSAAANKYRGAGLQNVKKRLDLLYTDKYVFEVVDQEEVFIAHLLLPVTLMLQNDEQNNAAVNSINKKYDMEMLTGG